MSIPDMSTSAKFATAKSGDLVALTFSDGEVLQDAIERVTSTHVFLKRDRSKWSRITGGHNVYKNWCIEPWTNAHAEKAARHAAGVHLHKSAKSLWEHMHESFCRGGKHSERIRDHAQVESLASAIDAYLAEQR